MLLLFTHEIDDILATPKVDVPNDIALRLGMCHLSVRLALLPATRREHRSHITSSKATEGTLLLHVLLLLLFAVYIEHLLVIILLARLTLPRGASLICFMNFSDFIDLLDQCLDLGVLWFFDLFLVCGQKLVLSILNSISL